MRRIKGNIHPRSPAPKMTKKDMALGRRGAGVDEKEEVVISSLKLSASEKKNKQTRTA